jgi:hypothetical protein
MGWRRLWITAGLIALVAGATWVACGSALVAGRLRALGIGSRTVPEVLEKVGPAVEPQLEAAARERGVVWPPARTTWVAVKDEKRLEAWVAEATGAFHHLKTYEVLAASGGPGPKRREGDRQVPEGFYLLSGLNPNSRYHLSVRVSYPNQEDIAHRVAPRDELGGDIFVHGSAYSVGCLAVGDAAIEELFVLAARVPPRERRILIVPTDFRLRPDAATSSDPWIRDLYARLAQALSALPRPDVTP